MAGNKIRTTIKERTIGWREEEVFSPLIPQQLVKVAWHSMHSSLMQAKSGSSKMYSDNDYLELSPEKTGGGTKPFAC